MKPPLFSVFSILGCWLIACAAAQAASPTKWASRKASLTTRWAADVDPANPLPEYPRPQLVRKEWQNLNGLWQFQVGKKDDSAPLGKNLSSQNLVPFPVESALSGVMEHHERLWYRRSFTVPAAWKGRRASLPMPTARPRSVVNTAASATCPRSRTGELPLPVRCIEAAHCERRVHGGVLLASMATADCRTMMWGHSGYPDYRLEFLTGPWRSRQARDSRSPSTCRSVECTLRHGKNR